VNGGRLERRAAGEPHQLCISSVIDDVLDGMRGLPHNELTLSRRQLSLLADGDAPEILDVLIHGVQRRVKDMRNRLKAACASTAFMLLGGATVNAWHLEGYVVCDGNGSGAIDVGDTPLEGVVVTVNGSSISQPSFSGSDSTDSNGYYFIRLPDDDGTFTATLTLPSGASFVLPAGGTYAFSTDPLNFKFRSDWLLNSPFCQESKCWLTGGGAKFSPITGTDVAEHGPSHSFGGNVYPGCSATAGDGGSWNHVAHSVRLHFHGTTIQVLRCGNVDGIPPGSTSPPTPFNFIEFQGTGTLKGIKGNKANYDTVSFFARAEDRNEPGSNGQRDGAGKDRYFLHVWDASGTLLLLDQDGSSATVDPITITDGNLQIHISSCDNPPQ